MNITAVIGMGPDSGKTSFLNYFIPLLKDNNVCLTSLGFNRLFSLSKKNVQKPKVFIPKGCLFTSVPAFTFKNISSLSVLKKTGVYTSIGEIFIYQPLENVRLSLCGPANIKELNDLIFLFNRLGKNNVIVDGAMDRKSSFEIQGINKLILAAGAGNGSLDELVQNVSDFYYLSSLSKKKFFSLPFSDNHEYWTIFDKNYQIVERLFFKNIMLEQDDFLSFFSSYSDFHVYISGTVDAKLISFIEKIAPFWKGKFILKNIFKLLFLNKSFRFQKLENLPICFSRFVEIEQIIINSFSPKGKHIDSFEMRNRFYEIFGTNIITDIAAWPGAS